VPGALETPYQSAPMDITEDSFYFARQDLIEDRLRAIEAGQARAILGAIDEEHRVKGTLCIGVRWDLFEREDLLEIVDVSNAGIPPRCL
jgi:Fanconi-associated nuclease 1